LNPYVVLGVVGALYLILEIRGEPAIRRAARERRERERLTEDEE
jgi:hypothetical protein